MYVFTSVKKCLQGAETRPLRDIVVRFLALRFLCEHLIVSPTILCTINSVFLEVGLVLISSSIFVVTVLSFLSLSDYSKKVVNFQNSFNSVCKAKASVCAFKYPFNMGACSY
jgi:hypothetical protein